MELSTLGLRDGQRSIPGNPGIITHSHWCDKNFDQLGYGDLDPVDFEHIRDRLQAGDIFIATARTPVSYLFQPDYKWQIGDEAFIITNGVVYQVLPPKIGNLRFTRSVRGIEIQVLPFQEAMKLIEDSRL